MHAMGALQARHVLVKTKLRAFEAVLADIRINNSGGFLVKTFCTQVQG